MGEVIKHISQIKVGDVLNNGCGHYVEVLEPPTWSRSRGWVIEVNHVRGQFSGEHINKYFITPREDGILEDLMFFHSRNPNGKRTTLSTVRGNKLKHHFI